ncbi:NrdH-redoxin (plasmid) [Micrococcus luteus]|uniref:glutaredoxin domain-containing protein n=1 Tax=Micrococcus luteus TaxID=1270 RepID=UPI0021053E35|nr:glutaredoxin domain-containing protein [Micrococcus luteus]UTX35919.1 NrdH-redoxin [Micrococcus luteus]
MTTEPEPAGVIVYSRPSCVQCTSTTRALDKRGIGYEVRPMTEDDAARFKAQGHMQAPVVVTEAETWAGYRPDKIIAIPTP